MNFAQFHTEDFGLKIAKDKVTGHSSVHKFGAVPSMSTGQSGTIWDVDDTDYPWSSWDTAGTVSIPAVVGNNNLEITIEGLDENYVVQTQTVTISDTVLTPVAGTWKRIYRAYCTSATNTADVLIQKDAVTVAKINADKGQTLMAVYTVPANYTAYIIKGTATCQANADATVDMFVRYFGENSFRVGHSFEVSGTGGQYLYEFAAPVDLPEKSDIDVKAAVRSNNARVTAAFDIILRHNSMIDLEK